MENDVINVTCNLQIYQTIWMNLALLQWNGTKFLILKFVSQDVEFLEFKQCFEESRVPDRFTVYCNGVCHCHDCSHPGKNSRWVSTSRCGTPVTVGKVQIGSRYLVVQPEDRLFNV